MAINQDRDTSWPGRWESFRKGKRGEPPPHKRLIPHLYQYHQYTNLHDSACQYHRLGNQGTHSWAGGIFATAVRAQCSRGILQLMVYVAICTNISISSPRRDKCILLQMNTSESALAAVPAWRCSFLCWKDELSDGVRTGRTEETGM